MVNYLKILVLLLIANTASAQKYLFVKKYKEDQGQEIVLECKVQAVAMDISKKEIKVYTETDSLELKVIKRKVDKYGSVRAKDSSGNTYIVSAMATEEGGKALVFIPEDSSRFIWFIANVDICE